MILPRIPSASCAGINTLGRRRRRRRRQVGLPSTPSPFSPPSSWSSLPKWPLQRKGRRRKGEDAAAAATARNYGSLSGVVGGLTYSYFGAGKRLHIFPLHFPIFSVSLIVGANGQRAPEDREMCFLSLSLTYTLFLRIRPTVS